MPHMHTPSVRLVRPLANGMKSYVSKLILIRIPPLTWMRGSWGWLGCRAQASYLPCSRRAVTGSWGLWELWAGMWLRSA